MKKSIFLYLTLILPVISSSQSWEWANSYGETDWDSGFGISVDINGDILIAGVIGDSAHFGTTTIYGPSNFLAKIDSMGNSLWAKTIFMNSYEAPHLASDSNGDIYYYSMLPGDTNVIDMDTLFLTEGGLGLIKFDGSGNVIWSKNFAPNVSGLAQYAGMHIDNDLLYLTGNFFDTLQLQNDLYLGEDGGMFIVVYDINGNEQWSSQYGTLLPGAWEQSYDVTSDQNGNAYVSGTFKYDAVFGNDTIIPQTNCSDAFLTKINPSGECEWVVHNGLANPGPSSGVVHSMYAYAVTYDGMGGLYYGGDHFGEINIEGNLYSSIGFGLFLAKYDTSGAFHWALHNKKGILMDLGADNEGNVFANGLFTDSLSWDQSLYSTLTPGTQDMFISKLDTSGSVQWLLDAGGRITWTTMSAPLCGSNRIYTIGHYFSGPADFDGANLDSVQQSNIYLASVQHPFPNCPVLSTNSLNEIGEFKIFPNPSNTVFNIQLSNPDDLISIFDMTGKKILISQESGEFHVIDASGLKKGVYVCKITSETGEHSTLLIVN